MKVLYLVLVAFFFSASAVKPIAQIQTKEVLTPIACDLPMPKKPKRNYLKRKAAVRRG